MMRALLRKVASKSSNRFQHLLAYAKTQKALRDLSRFDLEKNGGGVQQPAFNKTIWLLWLQGWDQAPWLVKQVAQSWSAQNPGWTVELLSADNLGQYIQVDYLDRTDIADQAKSDIIRLSLLQQHGGVWADATLLCMRPLDSWLEFAIRPSDFWMYHGNGAQMNSLHGPCSWFMVSRRDSAIVRKWKDECDRFWRSTSGTYDYFWMDGLFKRLHSRDREFRRQWARVPYVYCELAGQSHCLSHGDSLFSSSKKLKRVFRESPPFVLKLWWHRWHVAFPDVDDPKCKASNGYYAIQCALKGQAS
jgi:hypothetical protein